MSSTNSSTSASTNPGRGRGQRPDPEPQQGTGGHHDPAPANGGGHDPAPPSQGGEPVTGLEIAGYVGVGVLIAYVLGGLFLLMAMALVAAIAAAGFLLFSKGGGGHDTHNGAAHSAHAHSAPHLDGVHTNDLEMVKVLKKTWGLVPMGNTHWDVPVFRYEYGWFGDIHALYPHGDGASGWFTFGRHYVLPPWMRVFFVDTSAKNHTFTVEVVPEGSVTRRKVPVTVTIRARGHRDDHGHIRLLAADVDRLVGAADGEIKDASEAHASTRLATVVENFVRGAVNRFERQMAPDHIAGFFNDPVHNGRILEQLNRGLASLGIEATQVVFDAPQDPLGERIEQTRRLREEGVNANIAAGGGGAGAGTTGSLDMNQAVQAVLIERLLNNAPAAPSAAPQGGGNKGGGAPKKNP